MDGVMNITKRIDDAAAAEIAKIRADADAEIVKIREASDARIAAIRADSEAALARDAAEAEKRAESAAETAKRAVTLAARAEVLEGVYKTVRARLAGLCGKEREDFLHGYIGTEPYPYYVCVPVRKETAETVRLPASSVLSVLYYGDYDHMDEAWLTLGREVKARGLKPAGLPRVLGLVAPYTGREIAERLYCSRIVLPVTPATP